MTNPAFQVRIVTAPESVECQACHREWEKRWTWRYRIEQYPAGVDIHICAPCERDLDTGLRVVVEEDELLTSPVPNVAAFVRAGGDCGAVAFQPPHPPHIPLLFHFPCGFAMTAPFVAQMQERGSVNVLVALRDWHLEHHRLGHFRPAVDSPIPGDSWAPSTETAEAGTPIIRCPPGCPTD